MYQSGLYWKFIGAAQLLAGFLLLTQRYAKLGAVINLPIVANVFVITLSYYFAYTPVITGLMLLANLLLIVWDWHDLRVLVNKPQLNVAGGTLEKDKVWEVAGLLMFLLTFGYRLFVDAYNVFLWSAGCMLIGLVALVIGVRRWKRQRY